MMSSLVPAHPTVLRVTLSRNQGKNQGSSMERSLKVQQLMVQILTAKSQGEPFSKHPAPTVLNKNDLYNIMYVKLKA